MAQTWWSARLVGAMEQAGTSARMKHGRRYAMAAFLAGATATAAARAALFSDAAKLIAAAAG